MVLKKFFLAGFLLTLSCTPSAFAQFTSGLQGEAADGSGAVIPGATVVLTNTGTGVTQKATTNAMGQFRFVSLAPSEYEVTTSAKGFAPQKVHIRLQTEQTLNLPVTLSISSVAQTIQVSALPPVLDTAESRTQMTIGQEQLNSLPLPGRSILALTTLAPGVVGLGVLGGGGNGQSNDNYAAETSVSASANGRSSVGNLYIVDGLDITSNITPGVLNLVPNPDTVQEASVQVNTFSVEYGRNSSIVEEITTKSGTRHYHFMASDYFTNNDLQAGTEFTHVIPKYHTNNISATLGGPVPFLHQTYFFTGWEPLLALTAHSGSDEVFEDPLFTQFAQQNFPNSIGTKLLSAYPPKNVVITGVAKRASDIYPTTCGTPAEANIPCSLPIFDDGVFNAVDYRNGLQYNVRIDKYFKKDRVFGNYYNTTLDTGGPSIRVDMGTPQHYIVRSVEGNETHTFSPNTLNEAAFGFLKMEGHLNPTGPFHVPIVKVNGWSTNIGVSKADEKYVQHHFVWRDTLTHIYKGHDISVGYEGFHGDNLTFFGPWFSQPTFTFEDPVSLLTGNVYSETGVSYNLLTGQQSGLAGGSFQFSGNTFGLFAQDKWSVNRRLTLNYGVRWDDFGNPGPENSRTHLENFFYGPGTTIQEQVANGYLKAMPHVFNRSITAWSPRAGFAWDITGHGKLVLRGGAGMYHDWVTLGNVQSEFGNAPTSVGQTFLTGTTTAPVFQLGTSDTYPFGFTYPSIPPVTINSHGGVVGLQSNISGNDPNLKASNTYNYTVSLVRALGRDFSVAAGYSGSHSNNLFVGFAARTGNAFYGRDINNFPGSLLANNGKLVRLNPNFGQIFYNVNGPTSTYNAFIATLKGRYPGGVLNLSYTRSTSWDDAGMYPTVQSNTGNYSQYWSPSYWDVPNRISMDATYAVPAIRHGLRPVKAATKGWQINAITILQSGTPFTVLTTQSFKLGKDSAGNPINLGGDYNADGTNYDYPDIPSFGYKIPTSRKAELTGVFKVSDFPVPAVGTEGNELPNRYRGPGYADTDFSLLKNTHIYKNAMLQLRFEVYNIFNRANLTGISDNLISGSFGRATSQYNSRFLQLGAKFEF